MECFISKLPRILCRRFRLRLASRTSSLSPRWYEAPSNGQLLVYIYNPQYTGTSPITGVQVYVDDAPLPDGTFTATYQPYGPNAWTALISGPQGAFTGIEIKAAVSSSVGVGPLSEAGSDLSS